MNTFTVANDVRLIDLIQKAQRRLVFMAPAVSQPVAKALIECLEALGADAVTITLDVDAETHRLGYGDRGSKVRWYFYTNEQDARRASEQARVDDRKRCDDLRINPPQKFDLARIVNVFNSHIEFVEFELLGTSIDRKKVPIPSKFMGLAGDEKIESLLNASYRVVDQNASYRVVDQTNLSGKHLEDDKRLIVKSFLKSLPGYGTAILRTRKDKFEIAVVSLRKSVETFKKGIVAKLQQAMDTNRKALHKALLPSVCANPPKDWIRSDGGKPDADQVAEWLDLELREKFGTAEKLIGKMEVKMLYKAVTYESLKDTKFVEVAKGAFPSLERLLDESRAVKATAEE